MPIKFSVGEEVRSALDVYIVESVLNEGAFAHAARAMSTRRSQPVFLKRYFSPTPPVSWYSRFVAHQKKLKERINAPAANLKHSCYEFIDFFEGTEGRAKKTFHQVFEFVDAGKALQKYLDNDMKDLERTWQTRIDFAANMMMVMNDLHCQHIVHTDLKPDNLLLLPRERKSGYVLKVIDLDWAIFSTEQAPWHGTEEGYRGTFGYLSPEHLQKKTPTEASDLFTLCIMLGQLLGGRHPFQDALGNELALNQATIAGRFTPVKIAGSPHGQDLLSPVEALINAGLNPNPKKRPSTADVFKAVVGLFKLKPKLASAPPPAATPVPAPAPRPSPVPPPARAPTRKAPAATRSAGTGKAATLQLCLDDTPILSINIDTVVGLTQLRKHHEDARYFAEKQFKLHKGRDGQWKVSPVDAAPNDTLVNGVKLTSGVALSEGARIAIGNAAKGIEKMPLTVKFKQEE